MGFPWYVYPEYPWIYNVLHTDHTRLLLLFIRQGFQLVDFPLVVFLPVSLEIDSGECLCSFMRSWLHKIWTRIQFCPLDWRTTIRWNVVQTIFQHNHICQDCLKNTRSTFECMVILKSRGQGPKKMENYGTNLSRTFNKNLDLVPCIGE